MNTFNTVAAIFVVAGFVSAIIIACDLTHRKQSMKIMNSVWILTGLWASVLGLWAYFKFGRTGKIKGNSMAGMKMDGTNNSMADMDMKPASMEEMDGMKGMKMDMRPVRPKWQSVTLSTLHCGAGCTLADIIGETFMLFFPVVIAGSALIGGWVFDYILALAIGVFFQFAAIRAMEKIPFGTAISRAFKADVLSLTAWQVGMYGWMAIAIFGFFHGSPLPKLSWSFWFMMQVAMLCGFICAYPVNIMLIKAGIKKGM